MDSTSDLTSPGTVGEIGGGGGEEEGGVGAGEGSYNLTSTSSLSV